MNNVYVGLDIGTSNVRVVIGEYNENGKFEIIGVGQACSEQGALRKGVIVNIESTVHSIQSAIESAQNMAGCEVTNCFVGIGGPQVDSLNSEGVVAIPNRTKEPREINQMDVERAIECARSIKVPMDRQILHVIPQQFIVDDVQTTKNPINIIGFRLSVDVHIITAMRTTMQGLFNCASRAGYQIDGVMLKTLASAQTVLTEEEKNIGSLLIDMGGGTTDVIAIIDGSPICTDSIQIGGDMVTSDIQKVLGVSYETAEKIKIESGCCWEELVDNDEEVLLPGVGGQPPYVISRKQLCQIIQPRMAEILSFVKLKIAKKWTYEKPLAGNIALVGGCAKMNGIIELTSAVFNMKAVRIGTPSTYGDVITSYKSSDYATATGLALASAEQFAPSKGDKNRDGFGKNKTALSAIKNFFHELF